MPIKMKTPVRELIPDGFVDFMIEVVQAIDCGDEAAWKESDDLLQCENGYGGLYDEVEGRYGFEFLIDVKEEDGNQRDREICWYFDLERQEVRDIANRKVMQLQLWRCEPDCGRRFPRSDDYCPACDFPPS